MFEFEMFLLTHILCQNQQNFKIKVKNPLQKPSDFFTNLIYYTIYTWQELKAHSKAWDNF